MRRAQPVPGATVTLIRTDIREERTLVTPASGDVVFTNLQPGPYSLLVELAGFARLETTNLALSSSERLSVGDLVLKVGGVTETITIASERAPIQTGSSEHSALIDANQITELPTRGRDVFGLMATLPGVVYDGRGNDGIGQANSPAAFSGTRGIFSTANIDGVSGNVRSGSSLDTTVAMDTVAEVKVLLNNYQAEYGKAAAGVINIVTKSGSRDFNGSGYYYLRHEKLNANEFFRNASNLEKGRYRYNTLGATFGGPVYVPGLFGKNRNKLFFFGAYEYRPSTVPSDTRYYTVPTQAERNGDFNRSVGNARGDLYAASRIIDPTTGRAFPNGIIPANRIDPNMQKLLNVFPLPNAPDVINGGALNPSGQWYNYSITDSQERPGKQVQPARGLQRLGQYPRLRALDELRYAQQGADERRQPLPVDGRCRHRLHPWRPQPRRDADMDRESDHRQRNDRGVCALDGGADLSRRVAGKAAEGRSWASTCRSSFRARTRWTSFRPWTSAARTSVQTRRPSAGKGASRWRTSRTRGPSATT